MFEPKAAFSGFSIDNLEKAETFYGTVLGLAIQREGIGLAIQLPGGGTAWAYPKDDHQPATFTGLYFEVSNIDESMQILAGKGVSFECYDGMPQDDAGVLRGLSYNMGPDIAWFKDPAGNIIALVQKA